MEAEQIAEGGREAAGRSARRPGIDPHCLGDWLQELEERNEVQFDIVACAVCHGGLQADPDVVLQLLPAPHPSHIRQCTT